MSLVRVRTSYLNEKANTGPSSGPASAYTFTSDFTMNNDRVRPWVAILAQTARHLSKNLTGPDSASIGVFGSGRGEKFVSAFRTKLRRSL